VAEEKKSIRPVTKRHSGTSVCNSQKKKGKKIRGSNRTPSFLGIGRKNFSANGGNISSRNSSFNITLPSPKNRPFEEREKKKCSPPKKGDSQQGGGKGWRTTLPLSGHGKGEEKIKPEEDGESIKRFTPSTGSQS